MGKHFGTRNGVCRYIRAVLSVTCIKSTLHILLRKIRLKQSTCFHTSGLSKLNELKLLPTRTDDLNWKAAVSGFDLSVFKVSLLGVVALWGDCRFIPADWGS